MDSMKSFAQAIAEYQGWPFNGCEYYVVQRRSVDCWIDWQEFVTADSAFDRCDEINGGGGEDQARVVRRWR